MGLSSVSDKHTYGEVQHIKPRSTQKGGHEDWNLMILSLLRVLRGETSFMR
jgi:5-methylcytosine-specific restriction endonuclease McrA